MGGREDGYNGRRGRRGGGYYGRRWRRMDIKRGEGAGMDIIGGKGGGRI